MQNYSPRLNNAGVNLFIKDKQLLNNPAFVGRLCPAGVMSLENAIHPSIQRSELSYHCSRQWPVTCTAPVLNLNLGEIYNTNIGIIENTL